MKKILSILCLSVLMLSTGVVFSQNTIETHEITASVPELVAFHSIIAPMWHKAYPSKDMNALKALVPQIKENMAKMNSAKLPGILREKAAAWKIELDKFNLVADNYYAAASGNDDAALLLAAEKLHSAYEAMNRVVRPFNKEMDEYHKTLYVIYHKHLPEKNFDAISTMMENLILQADAVTKHPEDKLIKRLKEKTPKYYTLSKDLYTATVSVKEALSGKDASKKEAAIEKMHTTYQKLESVFE
ncbi:MAG TPA: hypothetical protein DEO54_09070 [Rikenellaceae bacterium]|nr:MAG: hypothetical protein A2X20_04230 [Bacteroidetes bacterium GWE2_40_15]PKP07591.1 MAG: hypothetical protein CVU10_08675 [Bacteroidetes bacterium HGW-Bacteroidetes-5]HBZ26364.1 hypothetical protein [Rikenellaceae bacterium]